MQIGIPEPVPGIPKVYNYICIMEMIIMNETALLAAIIIAIAFFGESIFGFGGGLISIPLLSLLIGVKGAVTLVLIFQLLTGLLIWKSYKHIDWKSAKPMTLSIVA